MQTDRVNIFSPKSSEDGDSVPAEHIIYAQVLETLLEVCKEDYEGSIKFLKEDDPKVQDIAALRFHKNHRLTDLSKRIKTWSEILFKHNITQQELPLLFQLFVSQFVLEFHNLSIQIKMTDTNMLTSRFM